MRSFFLLFSFFFLSVSVTGCSTGIDPYSFAGSDGTRERFVLCHGYGCTYRTDVAISDVQWNAVLQMFRSPASSAAEERDRIGAAVAQIEADVNRASGLLPDHAEAAAHPENSGQMDCIDETVNTTQALTFLEAENVFQFHSVGKPIHRGYFVDFMWPHNTATIRENATGQVYAVDTFYEDAGVKAHVVKKEVWLRNWSPKRATGILRPALSSGR